MLSIWTRHGSAQVDRMVPALRGSVPCEVSNAQHVAQAGKFDIAPALIMEVCINNLSVGWHHIKSLEAWLWLFTDTVSGRAAQVAESELDQIKVGDSGMFWGRASEITLSLKV